MARTLAGNDNVTAPGGDYPYGRMKDVSSFGAGDGTPLKERLFGDMTQFFERLMNQAGITANGNPENSNDGFQYVEALTQFIQDFTDNLGPQTKYAGFTTYTATSGAGSPNITLIATTYYRLDFETTITEFDLSGSSALDIVSFGDAMDIGTVLTVYFTSGSGELDIVLNSTNAGAYPVIKKPGVAASNTSYTITLGSVFKVMRTSDGWVIFEDTDT